MGKDYYKTLGVGKNATQDQIKTAFRKLAHQHHPDKQGGNEAKFKEINEAYQVLGDEKKRAQYDHYGSAFEHAQAGGGFSGFDGFRDASGYANGFNVNFEDLGDIFGGFGDIFGFNTRTDTETRRARRGQDVQVILEVSFMESVFGSDRELTLDKAAACVRCGGSGHEPGAKIETCARCKGSGRITSVQRTILGQMQVQSACPDCGGEGKIVSESCRECHGKGHVKQQTKLQVKIPAGIAAGEIIRLAGQGAAGEKGAPAGDLYIKVQVRPDPRFVRDGDDIRTRLDLSVSQAILGDRVEIATVDGPVELKIPEGTQPGTIIRLKGKGVPHLRDQGFMSGKRGDHLVEISVIIPKGISRKQREGLKELGL